MSTADAKNAPKAIPDSAAKIAAMHQALKLMPDNIDAMVALGGLYFHMRRPDEAAHWCNQALARKPGHAPAINILQHVGHLYVQTAAYIVTTTGDTATALEVFERAERDCGFRPARHYTSLFRRYLAWCDEARSLPREENSTRLSLAVWGKAYVANAMNLIRSLLAPGNVPALAARGKVRLEIMTAASERDILEASPVLAQLREHAEIDIFTLDDDILNYDRSLTTFHYWILAIAHYATVMRARHAGAHVAFLTADSLLADGSLAAARRYLDAGKLAVLVGGLEVEAAPFLAAIGAEGNGPIAVPARDMADIGFAHLHRDFRALIREPGKDPSAPFPNPMMFRIEGGVVQHGFNVLPLMVSAQLIARDFTPDFLTCDVKLVRLALGSEPPDDVVVCEEASDEICNVTMTRNLPDGPPGPQFDPLFLGEWATGWCVTPEDVPYFEWCFRQRRVVRGHGATGDVPPPDDYEREMVGTVLSAFRRRAATRHSGRFNIVTTAA